MPPEGPTDRLRQLIKVGQSRGHVLYDEIDAVLAPGREGVAELDQVLSELASNAIEVVDEPRTENSIPDESFLDRAESLGDLAPIRSYLQEVLTVARLTVKEEKQLARRIKEGSFKAGARLYATDESGKIYDGSDATELSSTPRTLKRPRSASLRQTCGSLLGPRRISSIGDSLFLIWFKRAILA